MLAVSFPFHLGAVVNPIRRALHVDAALVVAPLHGVARAAAIGQRRIGGVAAPPHRHQLLGLYENSNREGGCC